MAVDSIIYQTIWSLERIDDKSRLVILLNLVYLALNAEIIGETRRTIIWALPLLNIGGESTFRMLLFPLPVADIHLGRREDDLVIPVRDLHHRGSRLSILH